RAIALCQVTLTKLKKYTFLYPFDSQEEEIDFYKNYKGFVLTNLICFEEIRTIEIQFPELSLNSQRDFILRHEHRLKKFFKKHDSLVQYVELNISNLDNLFFTIKSIKKTYRTLEEPKYADLGFYSEYDFLIAKIKGFKKVLEYLKYKFKAIDDFMRYGKPLYPHKTLNWTGTKTQLTELIYALHASKSINNGKVDIVEIQRHFESMFQIKLNDIYKIYSEIKGRQKSRTKFLEEMMEDFLEELNKSFR
ncbi:MAG: RteC domain-containing protein, partial [Flavobacteriaceae bacterium]|nr:RteC domain-containing protein [Flavobacteriaceae bacterium]